MLAPRFSLAFALALVALPAAALSGPGFAPAPAAADHSVEVFNFGYKDGSNGSPVTLASVGDVVRFVWTSGAHTVTTGAAAQSASAGSSFESGVLKPGDSWEFVALEAGVFPYTCRLHPAMEGLLVVS